MAELDGRVIALYRHRGMTPSPEQWAANAASGVLVHLLITRREDDVPVGSVACYGADFRNGHAYVAAHIFPEFLGAAWPLEACALFLDYLFQSFPFRKLYGSVLGPNADQFASAFGTVAQEEGRLRAHEFVDGEFVDLVTVAIYRDQWSAYRDGPSMLLRSLRAEGGEDK